MILKLLILGDYGQFVWPAFIFTFVLCSMLYLKTKKALKKQEKAFLAVYKQPKILNEKDFKEKENTQEALPGSVI